MIFKQRVHADTTLRKSLFSESDTKKDFSDVYKRSTRGKKPTGTASRKNSANEDSTQKAFLRGVQQKVHKQEGFQVIDR